MTARINKNGKKSTGDKRLFSAAVAKILEARERELTKGRGIEISGLTEPRKPRIRGKVRASK